MVSVDLAQLAAKLGTEAVAGRNTTTLTVPPEKVPEACLGVTGLPGVYHLSTITGYDDGGVIDLLYQFWQGRGFVVVRTSVPRVGARIASISGSLPAATLYEAEIQDLLGVTFEGNVYTGKKLLLPDDYPAEAPPPLRKDADPEKIRKMMNLE
jgi:Ni,Fe-hydrogenase III component G